MAHRLQDQIRMAALVLLAGLEGEWDPDDRILDLPPNFWQKYESAFSLLAAMGAVRFLPGHKAYVTEAGAGMVGRFGLALRRRELLAEVRREREERR